MSQDTIDVNELKMERTHVEEEIEAEDEGGVELESPFVVKKRKNQTSIRLCKKQNSGRSVDVIPLVLVEL